MKICNICGSKISQPILNSESNYSLTSLCEIVRAKTTVFACQTCGHIMTTGLENLAEYYDKQYKILIGSEEEDQIYEVIDGVTTFRTEHQKNTLLAKLEIPKNAKLLDYGCAKASTIQALMNSRADIDYYLFDVSEMYVPFWQKFISSDRWATYETPNEWHETFDIITSFFSLEHIDLPSKTLSEINSLLKNEGIFYCIVPNVFTNSADFIVIDHVNHFTSTSLQALFAKCGLKIIEIDNYSHRGAFVIVAQKTSGNEVNENKLLSAQDKEVSLNYSNILTISSYWNDLHERIENFEMAQGEQAVSAIYGSGFYGSFIFTSLKSTSNIKCFIDQSPFRQGQNHFEKPIVSPHQIPREIDTIYVGLNPVNAKNIIDNINVFKDLQIQYFYL